MPISPHFLHNTFVAFHSGLKLGLKFFTPHLEQPFTIHSCTGSCWFQFDFNLKFSIPSSLLSLSFSSLQKSTERLEVPFEKTRLQPDIIGYYRSRKPITYNLIQFSWLVQMFLFRRFSFSISKIHIKCQNNFVDDFSIHEIFHTSKWSKDCGNSMIIWICVDWPITSKIKSNLKL